jgi:predicted Zn-dependent peptidase
MSPEEIEERVDAVTAGDIRDLADELFARDGLGLCILGPVDESAIEWNRDAA